MQPPTAGGASSHNRWIKDMKTEGGWWGWRREGGEGKRAVKRRLLFCQALVYFPCAQTPTPHNPIYILYKQKACQQAHTYIHIPLLPCQWGTIKHTCLQAHKSAIVVMFKVLNYLISVDIELPVHAWFRGFIPYLTHT